MFSAVSVFVSSMSNLIWGLTLLLQGDWIVLTPEAIVRFNMTTAGVIFLLFALFQGCVGGGILTGALWARVLGVLGASLNLLANMAFMSLYPAWAWLLIIIDGLVIFGLTVHGDEVSG
ncbi:MAG: hypothetical protein OEW29_12700 [Acidimicrobiia bacterium]|nr:hypothetical protein [Acidimicrobiia bacterium]